MDGLRNSNGIIAKGERYDVIVVNFYNLFACRPVGTIEEIPEDKLRALGYMDYFSLVRPLIAQDLVQGCSESLCAIRYQVSRTVVQRVAKRYKI